MRVQLSAKTQLSAEIDRNSGALGRAAGVLQLQSPAWHAQGASPRTSRRPPRSDVVGILPLPGEVCPPEVGAAEGRAGSRLRPAFAGAFKEAKPAEGGAGPGVCRRAPRRRDSGLKSRAAERSCCSPPGPARSPASPLASPLCPPLGLYLHRRGAAWADPARVYGAPTNCLCTRPQPAASSTNTASTVILGPAGILKQLPPPQPPSHVRTP